MFTKLLRSIAAGSRATIKDAYLFRVDSHHFQYILSLIKCQNLNVCQSIEVSTKKKRKKKQSLQRKMAVNLTCTFEGPFLKINLQTIIFFLKENSRRNFDFRLK